MKKYLFACLMISSLHAYAAPCMPIPITEFSQEMAQEFFNGNMPYQSMVLPAGSTLPLSITMTGDFFEFEGCSKLVIKRSLFIKFIDTGFLFSADGITWKTFEEFSTGQLSAGLNQGNTPTISLKLELNQR